MNRCVRPNLVRRESQLISGSQQTAAEDWQLSVAALETGLKWMAVAWSDNELHGIVFGYASRRDAEASVARVQRTSRHVQILTSSAELDDASGWVRRLVIDLERFADGEPVDFAYVPIFQNHLTPFGRRVTAACRRITWGSVSSYGELAAKCGAAGAARAVGTVMARNRFPIVVPCHRVLGAGGKLGGYSAPGGRRTKRTLLELESRQ